MSNNTSKTNIIEFGFDDPLVDTIIPVNGPQRASLQMAGLPSYYVQVLELLKNFISGVQVCEDSITFGWENQEPGLSMPKHKRQIKVSILVSNSAFQKSGIVPFLAHNCICVVEYARPDKSVLFLNEGFQLDAEDSIGIRTAFEYVTSHIPEEDLRERTQNEIRRDLGEFPEGTLTDLFRRALYHEIKVKSDKIQSLITESFRSGSLKNQLSVWYEGKMRKLIQRSLKKYSDIPREWIHRFIDEMDVEEVLDT